MYIIELICNLIDKFKQPKEKNDYFSFEEEKCEHTFFPIDSTGKILACSKCGKILKLDK